MTKAVANAIYDILVEELEAPADERAEFVKAIGYMTGQRRGFAWRFPVPDGFMRAVTLATDPDKVRVLADTPARTEWTAKLDRARRRLAGLVEAVR